MARDHQLQSSVQGGCGQMLPQYVGGEPSTSATWPPAVRSPAASERRPAGGHPAVHQAGDPSYWKWASTTPPRKNATTEAEFKEIMRYMVRQVVATGATPVLVTPQGRAKDFVDGVHSSVNRWYRNSAVALASEENVPLVDLTVLASAYFTEIGPEATLALFMKGNTLHPNRVGAGGLARLVSEDLARHAV